MNSPDTLPAWLARLESLHPTAIDLGLERVRAVALRLDLLAPGVPVVMVAGTNGKGSTSALLEALLLAHGKRAGCYTSPHILRFNERIRIDGREVSDADIVSALMRVDAARGDISLTYFEFTTLAALVLFTAASLDAWVLEIGLGGRLDAVNVIDADIAVITSIGLDHQEWLGNTREAIAREKAGILRRGKPVVVGDPEPPAALLDAIAERAGCAYLAGGRFTFVAEANGQWSWHGEDGAGQRLGFAGLPQPSLALANAATALQAFALLPWPVQPAALRRALRQVHLSGRNERVRVRGRDLVLDVGHNADGMRFLRAELNRHALGNRFHIVLGMLADKDIEAAVRVMEPLAASWHIAPLPTSRAAGVARLADAIGLVCGADMAVYVHASVADAVCAALASGDGLPVLVTGSFYTVSEAMTMLGQELPQ